MLDALKGIITVTYFIQCHRRLEQGHHGQGRADARESGLAVRSPRKLTEVLCQEIEASQQTHRGSEARLGRLTPKKDGAYVPVTLRKMSFPFCILSTSTASSLQPCAQTCSIGNNSPRQAPLTLSVTVAREPATDAACNSDSTMKEGCPSDVCIWKGSALQAAALGAVWQYR